MYPEGPTVNFCDNRPLILASGSPRRRELLSRMGYRFDTCTPDVDEHVAGHAREVVGILAQRKAAAACAMYDEGVIIASDTLVSLDGVPLGKPEDEADAHRMLRALSGREHEVFTGVCIEDAATGNSRTEVVRTGVRFRELTDEEIDAYIATGEPMDKAGAYAIQGGAGKFVERFDGSFENVVGFPVDEVRRLLAYFGK
ncbi:MAG: septum formation inhibitor Maf [Clostridiales bacterium]|nr:septum formation inhibitor Maf [Clostridiales bacterium]